MTPNPELPGRVTALLEMETSLYVGLSATAGSLLISTPCGDLIVPYALITNVEESRDGTVRMDASGTRIRLAIFDVSGREALLALLRNRLSASSRG